MSKSKAKIQRDNAKKGAHARQANVALTAPVSPGIEDKSVQEKVAPKGKKNDERKSKMSKSPEKPGWLKDNSNSIIAVFTAFIAVIAVMQGAIFWKQLDAMKKDQRPWIRIEPAGAIGPVEPGSKIGIYIDISNSGKTPARGGVIGDVYIEKIANGDAPQIDLSAPHQRFSRGMMMPGDHPDHVPIAREEPLTASEFEDLKQLKIFFIAYGIVRYSDFFGVAHWTRFCQPIVPDIKNIPPNIDQIYTGRKCHDYGDVDGN